MRQTDRQTDRRTNEWQHCLMSAMGGKRNSAEQLERKYASNLLRIVVGMSENVLVIMSASVEH